MFPADNLDHYRILSSMLAPALLMAATGSLLISANNRLSRVVDRLRSLMGQLDGSSPQHRPELELQISRHRVRSKHVLRACVMLYVSLGCFVGTSLALAVDAFSGFRLGLAPTVLAVAGVLGLLLASFFLTLEVVLAVRNFSAELDLEMNRRARRE